VPPEGASAQGSLEAGYTQGYDAGSAAINAPAVILDGNVVASANRGPLQRLADTSFAGLYRNYNQVPLGATLTIGNPGGLSDPTQTEGVGAVLFQSGDVLPQLAGSDDGAFNPLLDPLPANFVTQIRPALLGANGVSHLTVAAEGQINLPAGVQLQVPAGGSVTLGAGEVTVAGSIDAPAGDISLQGIATTVFGVPDVVVGNGASLLATGQWVNDELSQNTALAPLLTSGGAIKIASTEGSLTLAAGSLLDVSAGAQQSVAGAIDAGSAGSISVSSRPGGLANDAQLVTVFDPQLRGFGLDNGGSLSVALPSICISNGQCTSAGAVQIAPGLLTANGFSSISLAATAFGLTVAGDVNVAVQQQNLTLMPSANSAPTGTPFESLTRITTLPGYERKPEALSLTSTTAFSEFVAYADLTIAPGASLSFDPGAGVSLSTDSRILDNGTITDPGGAVSLAIAGDIGGTPLYHADQGIWLGSGALINVSGTFVQTPSTEGLLQGTLWNGGSIALTAGRGYLFALPGSRLEASGSAAQLDIAGAPDALPAYNVRTVASAGGSISLFGAEGVVLDGTLSAASGGPGAAGGALSVTLNGSGFGRTNAFPENAPQLEILGDGTAPTLVAAGTGVPASFDGIGQVPAAVINGGGFGQVDLVVRNLVVSNGGNSQVAAIGSVVFDGGVSLADTTALSVDAPQIAFQGTGSVTLSSAYVSLGSSDATTQNVNTAPQPGAGTLNVAGQFVDLIGNVDLQGFAQANISSSGDLRTVGVLLQGTTAPQGSLTTAGDLSLTAQQIYPSTLTQYAFDLTGGGPGSATLTAIGVAGSADTVLSAGGALSLNAYDIVNAGTIRAPLGAITLNAQNVTLSSGSVLSVSAAGQTIPFGTTQAGLDWVYPLPDGIDVIYGSGAGQVLPPQKAISITASNLAFNAGARIDLSGNGDLQAYEFVSGTTGTNDVLGSTTSFAILPGATLAYAPVDPLIDQGSTLLPGESVFLAGGLALPAGNYVLLPARYALLPGAYLVTPVSGYTGLAAGQQLSQLNGSVIVSGQLQDAGLALGATRTSGFDLAPGSIASTEAQYTVTSGNAFFPQQAASAGVAAPRVPNDAGTLAIESTATLNLNGTLSAAAGNGGLGAQVDLAATNLLITSGSDAGANPGTVVLNATQLDDLGAESILLGGLRSFVNGVEQITVQSDSIEVASGAALTAPELILVANHTLSLDSGASILSHATTGAAGEALQIPTGAAIVWTSTAPQSALSTQGSALGATASIASGATVGASGSLSIEAGAGVDFAGSLSATGGDVRLGSSQIALGTVPLGFTGFAISSSLISGLAGAAIELDSPAPVSVYGAVNLNLSSLSIDAPGLNAGGAGTQFTLQASQLSLQGTSGSGASATPGAGAISITAGTVNLGSGSFALSGVSTTSISAAKGLVIGGSGQLQAAGDLAIDAGVVQASGAYGYGLTAAGALSLTSTTAVAASTPAAGATLSLTASSVVIGANIVLPSGAIAATATGADGLLELTSSANLKLGGTAIVFDGTSISSPGGAISLSSDAGSVQLDAGAQVDVSAGTGTGAGGSLMLSAPAGTLTLAGTIRGAGGTGAAGAGLTVSAQNFDFPALVAAGSAGGFTGAWNFELQGSGDLVLPSGTNINASSVQLVADQGAVRTFGNINASSAQGGSITLIAQNDLEVGGTLDVMALANANRGGTIDLESESGGIYLDAGSLLSLGGQAAAGAAVQSNGLLWIRAPQSSLLTLLNADPATQQVQFNGAINGAAQINVVGNRTYQASTLGVNDVSFDPTMFDPTDPTTAPEYYYDAYTFMTNAPAITQALANGSSLPIQVLPGIVVQSTGDLTLTSFWDLSTWRFGPNNTVPGVLTLQAAGNLIIQAPISDGFINIDPTDATTWFQQAKGQSWSYQLTAGANLASANPLAVVSGAAIPATGGSLMLSPGVAGNPATQDTPVMIRTGTGSIQIAAAQNVVLGNQASVIYTAGAPGPGYLLRNSPLAGGLSFLRYPTGGGSIDINAGDNVIGAPSDQLYTDWLWRTGEQANLPGAYQGFIPTAWTINFATFEQGIAALGGGDLTVIAGGNITNLSASVPSVGAPLTQNSPTLESNQGILTVEAGGNIGGGKFLDMAGSGLIEAGGSLLAGAPQAGAPNGLYPILALGDSQLDVIARGAITIQTVLDPTLLPQSRYQDTNVPSYFATYSDQSSVSLQSIGGGVTFINQGGALVSSSTYTNFSGTEQQESGLSLSVYAPTLTVAAMGGDINVEGSMDLWPAASGNLELLATGSVLVGQPNTFGAYHIILSDADPTLLPNVTLPGITLFTVASEIDTISSGSTTGFYAAQPVHGGAYAANGLPDTVPAQIVALTGDVSLEPSDVNSVSQLFFAKPVDIVAGQDIVDLGALIEQYQPDQVSTISAGGSILYPSGRSILGQLTINTRQVEVNGPGTLQVSAGDDVNLGTSYGITSEGNLLDPSLPVGGAGISVTAGVTGTPGFSGFINQYLVNGSLYDTQLIQYEESLTGQQQLDKASALSLFQRLTPTLQQALLERIFFAEILAGGTSAAQPGVTHDDYTQAFDALEGLFPGSNPDLAAGATNAYSGDIDLYFSRIYTLSGGDIDLVAPGGQVNVGLATPPTAFGLTKSPSFLGIVAQGTGNVNAVAYSDVQVNQSRIFAADGGDIMLWSTEGDIDAGRGAKSAISAPAPTITISSEGIPTVVFPPALTGSGIQTLATTPGVDPGNVALFAPHGVVNADDAGIVAGNLTIAATAVLGTNNISVSGTSVGVPVQASAFGLTAAVAGGAGTSATSAAQNSFADSNRNQASTTPLADTAVAWLEVFVLGLGEDQCRQDDLECLKRQKHE
jgi:hypothetical protein